MRREVEKGGRRCGFYASRCPLAIITSNRAHTGLSGSRLPSQTCRVLSSSPKQRRECQRPAGRRISHSNDLPEITAVPALRRSIPESQQHKSLTFPMAKGTRSDQEAHLGLISNSQVLTSSFYIHQSTLRARDRRLSRLAALEPWRRRRRLLMTKTKTALRKCNARFA